MVDPNLSALLDQPKLRSLLDHYHDAKRKEGAGDWQDRAMELDGMDERELTRLHGQLLANGWLETRVEAADAHQPGRLTKCYRITSDGEKALAWRDEWAWGTHDDDATAEY